MQALENAMLQTCSIIKRTKSGIDETGAEIFTSTPTESKCLFKSIQTPGGQIQTNESGKVLKKEVLLFLPAGVDIEEGDFVSSTEPGFNKTYKVTFAEPKFWPFTIVVDHWEAWLVFEGKE